MFSTAPSLHENAPHTPLLTQLSCHHCHHHCHRHRCHHHPQHPHHPLSGKLFHSGLPHKSINPIELVMDAVQEIQKRFYRDFPAHPLEAK